MDAVQKQVENLMKGQNAIRALEVYKEIIKANLEDKFTFGFELTNGEKYEGDFREIIRLPEVGNYTLTIQTKGFARVIINLAFVKTVTPK